MEDYPSQASVLFEADHPYHTTPYVGGVAVHEYTKHQGDDEVAKQTFERRELDVKKLVVTEMSQLKSDRADEQWKGSISLKDRVDRKEITEEEVDTALSGKNVLRYMVRAAKNARTRCVDGRFIKGYMEQRQSMKERPLGPQNAGGTAGTAVAFRIARGADGDDYESLSFAQDFDAFADSLTELGYEIGAHTDNHSEDSPENTGCGAIDKMPEIIEVMTDSKNAPRVNELTQGIMGSAYDSKIYSEMLGNAIRVSSAKASYFKDYRHNLYDRMKARAGDVVSCLFGKHNEVAAIINRVYGTTFHRDEFSADSDNKIQAFNYDYWYTLEKTEALMKDHPYFADMSEERRIIEGKKLLTARVMYTVATLMTLTDGTIQLRIIDEKDDEGTVVDLFDGFGKRDTYAPAAIAA